MEAQGIKDNYSNITKRNKIRLTTSPDSQRTQHVDEHHRHTHGHTHGHTAAHQTGRLNEKLGLWESRASGSACSFMVTNTLIKL